MLHALSIWHIGPEAFKLLGDYIRRSEGILATWMRRVKCASEQTGLSPTCSNRALTSHTVRERLRGAGWEPSAWSASGPGAIVVALVFPFLCPLFGAGSTSGSLRWDRRCQTFGPWRAGSMPILSLTRYCRTGGDRSGVARLEFRRQALRRALLPQDTEGACSGLRLLRLSDANIDPLTRGRYPT